MTSGLPNARRGLPMLAANPHFVPPAERVVAFDQDGTLWVEQPMHAQLVFALDRVKDVVKAQPALANEAPFKAVFTGERAAMAKFTEEDLFKIVGAFQSGLTIEAFHAVARTWAVTARPPAVPAAVHRAARRPSRRSARCSRSTTPWPMANRR